MEQICLNCNRNIAVGAPKITLYDRRKGLKGSWQLIECSICGVLSMMPMPTEEQLACYYASYYLKNDKVDLTRRVGSRFPLLRKLYHYLSGDIDPRDFIHVPKGARVLDYGCGHAGYLSDFHDRGVAISGAEISGDVVEACQKHGYDVHKVNDFSHIPFKDGEFDVVYLMQVFEHLRDPNGFMEELSRIMAVEGQLYLALPNASSIWRRVFADDWVSGWFVPFHLFHFDAKSMANLADRYGFDLVRSWSNTPVDWFKLNLKARLYPDENQLDRYVTWLDSRPMRLILMLLLRIIELPFRERDCLVVQLRKRA